MEDNRARLEAAGLRVRRLEPLPVVELGGQRVAVSHMNFYLCNGAAIVLERWKSIPPKGDGRLPS